MKQVRCDSFDFRARNREQSSIQKQSNEAYSDKEPLNVKVRLNPRES